MFYGVFCPFCFGKQLLKTIQNSSRWAYLVACSLQSFLLAAALVALSIVYNQPLEDCAGLASSVEILFKHGAAPLYSMICTHALIHSGPDV